MGSVFFSFPPGKDEEGKARKEECIAKLQGVCVHGACFGSLTVPSCKESRKESFFQCHHPLINVFDVGYYFYPPVSCLSFVKSKEKYHCAIPRSQTMLLQSRGSQGGSFLAMW